MSEVCRRIRLVSLGIFSVVGVAVAGCTAEPGAAQESCLDEARCQLRVSPQLVTFSNASPTRAATVVIENQGEAPVEVVGVDVLPATAGPFFVRISPDDSPTPSVLVERVLDPGGELVVEVTYDGEAFGTDTATLAVRTPLSDLAVTADLITRNDEVRLTLAPSPIDFGTVEIGTEGRATATLTNSGSATVRVEAVERAGSPDFSVVSAEVPRDLEPGESMTIELAYTPTAQTPDAGSLRVEVTANEMGLTAASDLEGLGGPVWAACLDAVATGEQTRDGQGNDVVDPLGPRRRLEVERGSRVRLSGLESSDPDGDAVVSYQWRVAQVPPDFVLDFRNDTSPQMDLDLIQVGSYAFELDVEDAEGEPSCEPGRVEITVVQP